MFVIHCDGACLGNGSPNARAGWGIVLSKECQLLEENFKGKVPGEQNSIRAEIYAFLKTLELIERNNYQDVIISTDSNEVVLAATGKTKRSSNRDIWVEIERLAATLSCHNIKVKHCNKKLLSADDIYYRGNIQADLLAFEGAQKLFDLAEE